METTNILNSKSQKPELKSEKKHCNQLKTDLQNCLIHNQNDLTVCQEPFLKKIFWAAVCEPLDVEIELRTETSTKIFTRR